MDFRYNVCQKDGVITQMYQTVICRTSMHDIKRNKKVLDFYVPERRKRFYKIEIYNICMIANSGRCGKVGAGNDTR